MTARLYEVWPHLETVEEAMYAGECGAHAYTSIFTPVDAAQDPLFGALVDRAYMEVEGSTDLVGYYVDVEVARRVAAALAVVSFGSTYGAALAEKAAS